MKLSTLTVISGLMLGAYVLTGCSQADQAAKTEAEPAQSAATDFDTDAVQAAMTEYINAKLGENDSMYAIEAMNGAFDYVHDGVSEMDGWYVSCVDVTVGDEKYDVDLYVSLDEGAYTVGREVLHMINGEAVNRVLWEKGSAEATE